MPITTSLYKGKEELTMAQYEELEELDENIDYDIIDYPNVAITNLQMAFALTCARLFNVGDIFICMNNGTYQKGHIYELTLENGTKTWEDITEQGSSGTVTSIIAGTGLSGGTITTSGTIALSTDTQNTLAQVSNKINKVSGATSGNLPSLNSDGSIVDSGSKVSDFTLVSVTTGIDTRLTTVEGKIPSQATSTNRLADKAFVNSTVQTATANFRGSWTNWASVPIVADEYPADYLGIKTPSTNDYMTVQDASGYVDPQRTLSGTWRFKYSGSWATDGRNGWYPEYQVNETPLTAAQLAALNSGITSTYVGQIDRNEQAIADIEGDISSINTQISDIDSEISTINTSISNLSTSVSTKISKVSAATQNNIAVFDNAGNVKDGGHIISEFATTTDLNKYTYQTSAPTAAITDGGIHIVYLTSEPTTKYNGYIYLIAEA